MSKYFIHAFALLAVASCQQAQASNESGRLPAIGSQVATGSAEVADHSQMEEAAKKIQQINVSVAVKQAQLREAQIDAQLAQVGGTATTTASDAPMLLDLSSWGGTAMASISIGGINYKNLRKGDSAGGWAVLSVNFDGVVLKRGGQALKLSSGASQVPPPSTGDAAMPPANFGAPPPPQMPGISGVR